MTPIRPWLIAGLGNPGRKYGWSRHNAGFMVIDHLAGANHVALSRQKKFDAEYGRGKIGPMEVILLKPMAYMNRSGLPISRTANFFQIDLGHLLVIHDDIDMGYGNIKIKAKGGHGGHNGLRSIIDAVGSGDFPRMKIGIGRPEGPVDVSDYVLGNFTAQERRGLEPILDKAAEAVRTILMYDVNEGMNRFN
ncbi:MAG: aminoacyl-tRNA hydrolase [Desulfobacterales bacterium]|nr:aminoacyl-tRNA hydrolase [Desulfobacterales bacterium]